MIIYNKRICVNENEKNDISDPVSDQNKPHMRPVTQAERSSQEGDPDEQVSAEFLRPGRGIVQNEAGEDLPDDDQADSEDKKTQKYL